MDQAIEFMVGASLFVLALSLLFRTKVWISWLHQIEHKGRYFSLILGSVNVVLGSVILGFHWIWNGLQLLTTFIGAVLLLKGAIYMLFPQWLHRKLLQFSKNYKVILKVMVDSIAGDLHGDFIYMVGSIVQTRYQRLLCKFCVS
jgi:uncharacterized membrane protein HdeD (DUF308 family)